MLKISFRILNLLFVTILLTSCGQKNYTIPRTIKLSDTFKEKAIVFVHGLSGDANETWTNITTGANFINILQENNSIAKLYDIYPISYPSSLFNNNLSIEEIGNWFSYELKNENIIGPSGYSDIVFIAHSLGNLVLRSALNTNQDFFNNTKVRLIISLASPSEGSTIAKVAQLLPWKSSALSGLNSSESNIFLTNLNKVWDKRKGDTIVSCAYETDPMTGIGMIVSKSSASRACTRKPYPALTDHSDIAKPKSKEDRIAIWVTKEIIDLELSEEIKFLNAYHDDNDQPYKPSSKELSVLMECLKDMDYKHALEFITNYKLNKNLTMTCKDITTLMEYVFYSDSSKIMDKYHMHITEPITHECIEDIRASTDPESFRKSISYLLNTTTN